MQQTSARCGILRVGLSLLQKIYRRGRGGRSAEGAENAKVKRSNTEDTEKGRRTQRKIKTPSEDTARENHTTAAAKYRAPRLCGLGQAAGDCLVKELFHSARGFARGCFLLLA